MSLSFDPAMVCFRSCLVFTTALRAAEGCSDQGMGCNGAIPRPNHQKTSVMETRQSYVDANVPFAWPAIAAKDLAQTEVKQAYVDHNMPFAWPATAAKDSTLTEVKQSYSDANIAFAWPATAAKDSTLTEVKQSYSDASTPFAWPATAAKDSTLTEVKQSYSDASTPFAWPATAAKDSTLTEVKQSYSDASTPFAWPATAAKDSAQTEVKQSYSDASTPFAWPATAAKDSTQTEVKQKDRSGSGKDVGSEILGWGPDGYSRFFDTEDQKLAFFQEHLTGQRTEWIAPPSSFGRSVEVLALHDAPEVIMICHIQHIFCHKPLHSQAFFAVDVRFTDTQEETTLMYTEHKLDPECSVNCQMAHHVLDRVMFAPVLAISV